MSTDVIVIGGGLSGVRAARDLGEAGREVLILEARDRLGGRIWTRPFRDRGEMIELGGAWVATKVHPFVAEEIHRYHLKLVVSHGGSLDSRWLLDGERAAGFPLDGDDLYALERVLFEIIRASHRIDLAVPRDQQELEDLDVSIEAFLNQADAPPRVRDYLYMWAGLGSGALPSEWSMLTALTWIAAMDHSVYGWYGAVTDRFEIGMNAVVDLIASDSGADVQLSAPVRRVEQAANSVEVTTADDRVFQAKAAIVATPLGVWPDIEFVPALPDDKLMPSRQNHAGRMKKTWMVVRGMPSNLFASGWGADFVQMFPEEEIDEGCIVLGMCSPPSTLDTSDLDAVNAAVRQYVPDAEVLGTDVHDWASDPYSKGTWLVAPPGMHSRYHSALGRREGRVAFAGADVAVRWIGWLDGALEAGAKAASEVLTLLDS